MAFEYPDLPRPIVVLGTPRSGTSLTAGILAEHGVWTGRCMQPDDRNARGYFENLDIKAGLIEIFGRLVNEGRLAPHPPKDLWASYVEYALRAGNYAGGPWLVKHSAMYYPAWERDFDPIYVCCFRDPESIAASGKATGLLDKRQAIHRHHATMKHLVTHRGAFSVWPHWFLEGEFAPLERAFEAAGVPFDRAIAERFVDPSLWHYREGADAVAS